MPSKKISQKGIDFIKGYEQLRLIAYKDAVGVWTIGWGHILGVKPGDQITPNIAEAYLKNDLVEPENAVNRLVKVPLTQDQYDALVSFVFNCGVAGFKDSTLLKLLNQNKYIDALREFKRWNKGNGGEVINGLTRRRKDEAVLFAQGIQKSDLILASL